MVGRHTERMERFQRAGLYLVTGEILSRGRTTEYIVQQALSAGVRLVQMREKDKNKRELYAQACSLKKLCLQYNALLIIDDHVDIALAAGADGVHLGNEDLNPEAARTIFPDGIIGVSTHCPEEATRVDPQCVSYYNIGPIFPTKTKHWEDSFLGAKSIPRIASCCALPFTVMGGINASNIQEVIDAGAKTIAVVTAVTKAEDPAAECQKLLRMMGR